MDSVYAKSTDIRMIFSNPKAQYLSHTKEIDAAISRVLNSGWYILGDEVEKFEDFEKDWKYSFINATKYFIEVIKYGGKPILSGNQAINILKFNLAAIKSADMNKEIFLDDM